MTEADGDGERPLITHLLELRARLLRGFVGLGLVLVCLLPMANRLYAELAKPLLARGAVRVVGLNAWTKRNFARWMFEDEHRAVLLTPRRWHRHFLKRPGAYRP